MTRDDAIANLHLTWCVVCSGTDKNGNRVRFVSYKAAAECRIHKMLSAAFAAGVAEMTLPQDDAYRNFKRGHEAGERATREDCASRGCMWCKELLKR